MGSRFGCVVDSGPASSSGRVDTFSIVPNLSRNCHTARRPPAHCRPISRRSPQISFSASSNGTTHNRQHLPAIERSDHREGDIPLIWTKFVAETLLPTGQGKFRLRGYRHTIDGGRTFTEPSAIISGSVEGQEEVVVRVHDACFTSEVLGSLKCDCKEQLQLSLDYIQDAPPGMVIYLQQEGRGIGLANKIAAYALQEKGLDTVDANRALGLPDDCREYSAVGHILQELGVKSIRLMTNNPRKINELAALGINVVDRVPCQVKSQKYNKGYLSAKQRRMKHIFREEDEELDGQYCFWEHEGEPSSAGIPLEMDAPAAAKNGIAPAATISAVSMPAAGAAAAAAAAAIASRKIKSRAKPSDFECGGSAGSSKA